jgi:hypothetical protein
VATEEDQTRQQREDQDEFLGPTTHLELYRLTVRARFNEPLFAHAALARGRGVLLREAILKAGNTVFDLNSGIRWRVAPITEIDATGLRFHFGKSQNLSVPVADNTSGDFTVEEINAWPNTHVIVDTDLQVAAIGRNTKLAQNTRTVSLALQEVLSATTVAKESSIEIRASPIEDPTDFLERLKAAAVVTKLWLTIPRPNPFDVEEDFHRPTSAVLEELKADNATVTWQGQHIDAHHQKVPELVRSAATSGGSYGATIKETQDSQAMTIRQHKTAKAATLSIKPRERVTQKTVLERVKAFYHYLRGKNSP